MTAPDGGTAPAPSRAATTVLVVDDQTLVRDGFAMILDAQPDLAVVGTAADGAQAAPPHRGAPRASLPG